MASANSASDNPSTPMRPARRMNARRPFKQSSSRRSTMERRNFFKSMLAMAGVTAGVTAGLAAGGAATAATPTNTPKNKQKVVYHLSDAEKVAFVLSNIQNHIAGVGGPENVEIVLVVHGPALKAFHQALADPSVKQAIGNLKDEGVSLDACANTMKAQKVDCLLYTSDAADE